MNNNNETQLSKLLAPLLPNIRQNRASIEPVSQVHLSLYNDKDGTDVFEKAQSEILKFMARRAGGTLPPEAMEGKSFSIDDVGARRVEGIAIDEPKYWTLRFDDDDRNVAGRSWVIETALAKKNNEKGPVHFGLRLQCIARGENPHYIRSVPNFCRDILRQCHARLDGRRVELSPWFIETEYDVETLVDFMQQKDRKSDIILVSLPEYSSDPKDSLIDVFKLSENIAGAAHVAVISGHAAFYLSDQIGREFSVYQQAVRTYRPGFDPGSEDPFSHPLSLAQRIRDWSGGPEEYHRFVVSEVLRRTVSGPEAFERLPSFAEAKRTAAALRRQQAKQSGSTNDELFELAIEEIEELKKDIEAQKQESDDLLKASEEERENAEAEVLRLRGTLQHLQQRVQSLSVGNSVSDATIFPNSLDELEHWAAKNLVGSVELHNRALRGAKQSEYEDASVIYQALLLLRDYYVPMRREGKPEQKQAFDHRCQELGIEEQQSFAGNRAGEHGEEYFIRIGPRRIELDRHLKKGNSREPRYCFRLYFFWDDATSQVVVGWLPSHLTTRAS
ncbi:MAG: hypothetical protein ACPGOY_01525 [Rhodospirillaceae bacterium]